jgi:hypothetical protein
MVETIFSGSAGFNSTPCIFWTFLQDEVSLRLELEAGGWLGRPATGDTTSLSLCHSLCVPLCVKYFS